MNCQRPDHHMGGISRPSPTRTSRLLLDGTACLHLGLRLDLRVRRRVVVLKESLGIRSNRIYIKETPSSRFLFFFSSINQLLLLHLLIESPFHSLRSFYSNRLWARQYTRRRYPAKSLSNYISFIPFSLRSYPKFIPIYSIMTLPISRQNWDPIVTRAVRI